MKVKHLPIKPKKIKPKKLTGWVAVYVYMEGQESSSTYFREKPSLEQLDNVESEWTLVDLMEITQ